MNLLHLLQSCTNGQFHMLFLAKLCWFHTSVVIYNAISVRFNIILSSLCSWLWIMFISALSISHNKQTKCFNFLAARQNFQELHHSLNELSGERAEEYQHSPFPYLTCTSPSRCRSMVPIAIGSAVPPDVLRSKEQEGYKSDRGKEAFLFLNCIWR